MTKEQREKGEREAKQLAVQIKDAINHSRGEARKIVSKEKDKNESTKLEKLIQKLTQEMQQKVEQLLTKKIKEISSS